MLIGIDARFLGASHSGLARYSENLIWATAQQDDHNQYIVFVNANLSRKLKLGDNFRICPVKGNPMSVRGMFRLSRALRREKVDLLHVHFPLVPPWLDCPSLITVHDVLPFKRNREDFRYRMGPNRWLWSMFLYPQALRRAKWVVSVSQATRTAVCDLFPEIVHKSVVIHSGADPDFGMPIEPSVINLIRTRLDLPARYLLYSGSTRRDKNIEGILRAFATLHQNSEQHKDLHLVLEVGGDRADLTQINQRIAQFGLQHHVRFLFDMNDEERRVVFADAHALFVLSRTEGFGFPILEAQMSGVPVVAADAGALPEVAGEHGAIFVDPDNLDDIVSKLERILSDDDLRAWLIERGKENCKRFDWNQTASQLIQIYDLLFYPRDQVQLPAHEQWISRLMEWIGL